MSRSLVGSANRLCDRSAFSRSSAGRSRGSWMDSAAAMIMTSRATLRRPPSTIIRASRGSIGSCASARPVSVSRAPSSAPSSVSSWTPSRTARVSGGSTNGKSPISSGVAATPTAIICRITEAEDVRRISGSVYSGRASKSSWL